jgi:hypothetical protein
MKLMAIAAAISLALSGTAIVAQPRPADHERHETRSPAPPPEVGRPDRHGQRSHVNRSRHYSPPKHWTRGQNRWDSHRRQCARRYSSYNPRTDTYRSRHGQWKRCRL